MKTLNVKAKQVAQKKQSNVDELSLDEILKAADLVPSEASKAKVASAARAIAW